MTQLLDPAPAVSPTVESESQLVEHLRSGVKTGPLRVGMEHEALGYNLSTWERIPYAGPAGIRALLEGLARRHGYQLVLESGNPVAARKADRALTLEPGGQVELSGAPHLHLPDLAWELDEYLQQLGDVAAAAGVGFFGLGYCPRARREDVPWMPKARYVPMRAHLERSGGRGLDMMLRTATVQASLDFKSEEDMGAKLQVALGVSSLVTALWAASPWEEGQRTGWKSQRMRTWMDTDSRRCGLLRAALDQPISFAGYVQWALDVPLIFLRQGVQHTPAPTGLTFRRWMQGDAGLPPPTLADWEDLLSTLFPDVRLRRYLETRTADSGPRAHLLALPALWKGLLYWEPARRRAWTLVSSLSMEERLDLRVLTARDGMQGRVRTLGVGEGCVELCLAAQDGLRALGEPAAAAWLDPMLARARARRSLADDLLELPVEEALGPRTRLC